MKKIFNFELNGIASLANLILTGLKGYATDTAQLGGTTTFWCLLGNGDVLRIYSKMTDIRDWEEVGTLAFRITTKDENLPEMIALPASWDCITSVEKLELNETDFSASSGLAIQNSEGEELTVVCGANVYSIQIRAPFFAHEFKPEYEITKYKRCPF